MKQTTDRPTIFKDPATWENKTEPTTTKIPAPQPPRSRVGGTSSANGRAREEPRVPWVTWDLWTFPDRRRVRRIDDWRRYGMNGVATRASALAGARASHFRVNTPETLSAGGSEARLLAATPAACTSDTVPGPLQELSGLFRGYFGQMRVPGRTRVEPRVLTGRLNYEYKLRISSSPFLQNVCCSLIK